ncbi:MAG: HEAT repeat domain-containing protein [Gemmataceae bacterium]|nr:HEAT repeat domain-containing protein [Gemmataceae bacterium]
MSLRASHLPTLILVGLACLPLRGQEKSTPTSSPEEIKQLVKDLGDFHFETRQKASERLDAIGLPALPALQEATKSRDPEVCQRAWRLIDDWGAKGMVPALLFKLSDDNMPVRAAAADSLGKLGAAARTAIPALNDAMKDRSEVVRCCAREAIKVIESTPELKLEVVDLDGPVTVGNEARYRIKIANTGTASATTVRILVQVPEELSVHRVEGPNFRRAEQRIVSIPQTMDPNTTLEWEIHTRAQKKANVPLTVELLADQLPTPLRETKTTTIDAPAGDTE